MDVPAACLRGAPGREAVGGYVAAEPALAGGFTACFLAHADVAGVEVAGAVAAFEAGECVGYVFAVDDGGVGGWGEGLNVEWHDTMLPRVLWW